MKNNLYNVRFVINYQMTIERIINKRLDLFIQFRQQNYNVFINEFIKQQYLKFYYYLHCEIFQHFNLE